MNQQLTFNLTLTTSQNGSRCDEKSRGRFQCFRRISDKYLVKRNTILQCVATVLLVAVVCYFQACSPVRFSSLPSVEMDSGNGFGYGGKPSRDFYHYVPEFTCEGKSIAQSRISIFESLVEYSENSFHQCNSSNTSLSLSEIQNSAFHEVVIGHRGNIYEYSNEMPKSIPDNLIEAWCHVQLGGSQTAEILVQYNRKDKLSSSQITVGESRTKIAVNVSAQDTIREVHQFDVDYKIGETTLNIDKRKPSQIALGQFEGTIRSAVLEGSLKNYTASCYLGGLLDSRLWPAQMVFDANASQVEIDANNNFAYVVEKSLAGGNLGSLFEWDLTSQQKTFLIQATGNEGVRDFKQSPDGQYLVLRAVQNNAFEQVFKFELENKSQMQLNTTATSAKQWPGSWMLASGHYFISSDSKYVFYMDGTHDSSNGDVEPWLYRVPSSGGTPLLVNHVIGLEGTDLDIFSYIDVFNSNRVFYLAGDPLNPQLYYSNLETGDRQKITPNLGVGWSFNLNMKLQKYEPTNSVFAVAETAQNKKDMTAPKNRVYQFSPTGQLLKTMEFRGEYPKLSSKGKWYYSGPIQKTFYDLSGKSSTGVWPHLEFYSLNTNQYFQLSLDTETPWSFDPQEENVIFWNNVSQKLISKNIATNTSSELCSGVFNSSHTQKIHVLQGSQNSDYLLVAVTNVGTGHVYQMKDAGKSCELKNTFFINSKANLNFRFHESSRSLFVVETNVVGLFETQNDLKLVPFDGLPPLGLTQVLRPGIESYEQHFMLPERNSLIVVNRDRFTGMRKVYRFPWNN